jgi:molybdopterin-guanine dinucleotide biosynthesis protein A
MTEHPSRWLSTSVAGVILAGGRNTRMGGRDKAFLRVDGQTVFARTLSVLRECFEQVIVVSNTPEKYADFSVEVVADELRGCGPLGGLHAGLGRIAAPYAFVAACDMPFLHTAPIRYLVSRLGDQDAIVPCWNGDIEPLHALYARRLRGPIAAAVGRGARAMRELLPQIEVEYVSEAALQRVAGTAEAFRNVNTPEDAARFAVQV